MWNADERPASGTTCVIFDGNPGGSKEHPDWGALALCGRNRRDLLLGRGRGIFANCMKAGGITLSDYGDPRASAPWAPLGSPLSPRCSNGARRSSNHPWHGGAATRWRPRRRQADDLVEQHSAAPTLRRFIGGNREMPQVPGEMQCRMLGAQRWRPGTPRPAGDRRGGRAGVRSPIPSMPLYLGAMGTVRAILELLRHVNCQATAASPVVATAPASMGAVGGMATGSRSAPTAAAPSMAA